MDKITVANEILLSCVKSLSAEFVYFAYPLGKLGAKAKEYIEIPFTDGMGAYFSPEKVCEKGADGHFDEIKGEILHLLMHCIFLHPFKLKVDSERYSLACDITVGYILDSLQYSVGDKTSKNKRKAVYKLIIDKFGGVNDNFTKQFVASLEKTELEELRSLFTVCDHFKWLKSDVENNDTNATVTLNLDCDSESEESLAEGWASISRNLIPQIGKLNPELRKTINVALGGESNYKSFLRTFLRKKECIKSSEEEFDYIYYCLGLNLYKNTPLIENLEYSDERDFSEIAIALDTSGSTDGEPVKKLLNEVFSLIKSMETASMRYKVRIIQCDLKVQREDVVYGSEEFANLMKNYRLIGGGGTDFRPVFNRLTDLKKKGEKIEGLIYFTDGVGVYPTVIPPFKTCFVVLNDEEVEIPHFAYKINVEKELL